MDTTINTPPRRPSWLKIKLNTSDDFQATKDIISNITLIEEVSESTKGEISRWKL